MKNQANRLKIIQYIVMAALLAFIVMMLVSGRPADVSMDVIKEKMTAVSDIGALTEKSMNDAAQNFAFDVNMAGEGMYRRVDDVMDVNELLILRIADDNNRQAVFDAIEKYLEEKTASFDGYGTNQHDLLSNAILEEQGEYIFFGVSEKVLEWESAFLDALK